MLGWDDGQTGVDLSLLSSRRIDGTKVKSVELINGAAGQYCPCNLPRMKKASTSSCPHAPSMSWRM